MSVPPRRKLSALAPAFCLGLGLGAATLTGCSHGAQVAVASPTSPGTDRWSSRGSSPGASAVAGETTLTADGTYAAAAADRATVATGGSWIGARAVHDVVLARDGAADIGLWVDAPATARSSRRPRVDVALVIDVSGSMSGAKFAHAQEAARTLVAGLVDGDIVSIDSFESKAHTVCPPLVLDARTRQTLRQAIDGMHIGGGTNMFDGLELAEGHAAAAPSTHAVRRVVVLSDGQANVGPSSPELLGAIAERGLDQHTQVTSIGLGLDYDERTLDALAVRSGGRMYHLDETDGVDATLRDELALLTSAVASDAYVEVIPAPGVRVERIFGVGGWHGEATASSSGGTPTLRIPLGSLFAGQHREALLRVRFDGKGAVWRGQPRALASVRLPLSRPRRRQRRAGAGDGRSHPHQRRRGRGRLERRAASAGHRHHRARQRGGDGRDPRRPERELRRGLEEARQRRGRAPVTAPPRRRLPPSRGCSRPPTPSTTSHAPPPPRCPPLLPSGARRCSRRTARR